VDDFQDVTSKSSGDSGTIAAARDALAGTEQRNPFKRLMPFLGPAFIACVAYIDPGNFATNIQAGSEFGYTLVWVILASNLMAMLIQTLSAKLGIATGKNLAEHCRERFPRSVVYVMWVIMEIMAIATDLAEFLGAAIGFNLIFGFPLFVGGLLTGIATTLILALEQYGFRKIEAIITSMVGIIAVSYLIETVLDRPDWHELAVTGLLPNFSGPDSIVLATGIVGATVMPHVIFLHSALMQGRIVVRDPSRLKRLFRYEIVDVIIAMGIAGLVNAAMLIMAAATFHRHGLTQIATIEDASKTLEPLLGSAARVIFGISLLASGLSSSTVGTSAGQVVMQGFINKKISVWVRRGVTMVPSLVVIAIGLDPTRTLVISQVILSFALPFAILPLIIFTARKDIMGVLVSRSATTIVSSIVAALILALNVYLLVQTFAGG